MAQLNLDVEYSGRRGNGGTVNHSTESPQQDAIPDYRLQTAEPRPVTAGATRRNIDAAESRLQLPGLLDLDLR
jgi:hypothetical protein